MFHSGDLQSGIALALQHQRAVLCFIRDNSEKSTQWEETLTSSRMSRRIQAEAVALKIEAGSQEADFLAPICLIASTPAIIVIKNASLQANLQSAEVETEQLNTRLEAFFGHSTEDAAPPAYEEATIQAQGPAEEATQETGAWPPASAATPSPNYLTLPPPEGQFRLPNNAYDAMREHTQQLLDQDTNHQDIYQAQLRILDRLPILRDEVSRLRATPTNPTLSSYAREKLLRMPAAAVKAQAKAESSATTASSSNSTPSSNTSPPPGGQHTASIRLNRGGEYVYIQPDSPTLQTESEHSAQVAAEAAKKREEAALWTRLQRERQQKDREARDRIKAQIAVDREERRRLADVRSQNERIAEAEAEAEAAAAREAAKRSPGKGDVRLQVRTFDGSTLKNTFEQDSTLASDVRPWIDSQTTGNVPYNLKVILTPLPNRNIEAAEEEQSLSDLGIRRSGTLVMVPVKGYVESYTGSTSGGLVGSALSGSYSLVTGAAGTLLGSMKYVLGYGGGEQPAAEANEAVKAQAGGQASSRMKVRTLADQRVEQMDRQGPNSQLYNGNALNFEPNRDEDEDENENQKKD